MIDAGPLAPWSAGHPLRVPATQRCGVWHVYQRGRDMSTEDFGRILLEASRYLILAQAIVGVAILAGLIVWRDAYHRWVRDRKARRPEG